MSAAVVAAGPQTHLKRDSGKGVALPPIVCQVQIGIGGAKCNTDEKGVPAVGKGRRHRAYET
jgi:hypothetical protein